MRRVGEVERFGSELQAYPLSHTEFPENRNVDFEQPRTVQNIAAGIAERVRRWAENAAVLKYKLAGPDIGESLRRSVDLGPLMLPGALRLALLMAISRGNPLGPSLSCSERDLIAITLREDVPPVPIGEPAVGPNSGHNRCMKRLVLVLVTLAPLAMAESFSGTVVDVMCRGKDLASHTRECALTCSKSGYALVTADGRFLKFDEAGNARTLSLLKKLAKEKDLKAKVSGTLDGDLLKVEGIEF